MKLAYLTTVQIGATSAQSLQIQSMARAFGQALGSDFLLISPLSKHNYDLSLSAAWRKVPVFGWSRVTRYLPFILQSLAPVRKFSPDIIFTRDIGVAWLYTRLGYHVTYEMHKPFETKIGEWTFRNILSQIQLIVISQALADFVVSKYAYQICDILVVHDGVFLEDFVGLQKDVYRRKLIQEADIPADAFVILYPGSIEYGRGLETIEAAAEALKDKKVYFVIIGLRQTIALNKKVKNIIFLPKKDHSEILGYLVAADALLLIFTKQLIAWQYRSPLKLFEFMASGVPIVASDLGSVREVIHADIAYLFDPEKSASLTHVIEEIQAHSDIAKAKAQQAKKEVEQYTWQKRVQHILAFLSQKI